MLYIYFQNNETQVVLFLQFNTSLWFGNNICIAWLMWVEMIYNNI